MAAKKKQAGAAGMQKDIKENEPMKKEKKEKHMKNKPMKK